ncbi:MAG: redoxin domain-containing protein [Verrucomicrobia bacterium]|nr:redoxin domain-containing protein [Verrucomicrobiota bacterium]
MLGVSAQLPEFKITATVGMDIKNAFTEITHKSYPGQWLILFFWPRDFTFLCPTEVAAFGKMHAEFSSRDAQLLGGSTDSEYVHLAWKQSHDPINVS